MRDGGYNREIVVRTSDNLSTATANVIVGPIDISRYERYALWFQNNYTAAGINDMKVQLAIDASAAQNGSEAQNWVTVNTATIPFPSSLGPSAIVMTSAIENGANWLRIVGAPSATAAGNFRLHIGGFGRKG